MQPGDIVNARVVSVQTFGAFCDFEGVEILILAPEITWRGRVLAPDILSVGDQLSVQLLHPYTDGSNRWAGSRKRAVEENPYEALRADLESGTASQIRTGIVHLIVERDATIHLSPLLRGHATLLATDDIRLGQRVRVKILEIDVDRGDIELEILETPE